MAPLERSWGQTGKRVEESSVGEVVKAADVLGGDLGEQLRKRPKKEGTSDRNLRCPDLPLPPGTMPTELRNIGIYYPETPTGT